MATLKTICPGCFKDKGPDTICRFCGFDEDIRSSNVGLPFKTLLNQKQYVVGKILGKQGGFGITYLGFDIKLKTKVAIKEFYPRGSVGRDADRKALIAFTEEDDAILKEGTEQFLEESRMIAQFSHPNIVKVRSFFEENNTAYIVMDYYDGISLDEYLTQQGGNISEDDALSIMLPILDGLKIVHENKVLHRDIKPQNIFVTNEGTPILLDFGTARFAMSEKSQSLTVVLSQGFAPFEQYQKHGKQGPWTDIYAYGATLYTILSGVVPIDATSRKSHLKLIPISQLVEDISQKLNNLINKCMSMEISNRPQNADEVFRLLDNKPAVVQKEQQPSDKAQIDKDGSIVYDYLRIFPNAYVKNLVLIAVIISVILLSGLFLLKNRLRAHGDYTQCWDTKKCIDDTKFECNEFVITDTETKLQWPRNANLIGEEVTIDDAGKFIETLNNKKFAGFDDWRIASGQELNTLVDYLKKKGTLSDNDIALKNIGFCNVREFYATTDMVRYGSYVERGFINLMNGKNGTHDAFSVSYFMPLRTYKDSEKKSITEQSTTNNGIMNYFETAKVREMQASVRQEVNDLNRYIDAYAGGEPYIILGTGRNLCCVQSAAGPPGRTCTSMYNNYKICASSPYNVLSDVLNDFITNEANKGIESPYSGKPLFTTTAGVGVVTVVANDSNYAAILTAYGQDKTKAIFSQVVMAR
ncbi:MAG: protein kinase [Nitrospirae bacterium]|nr:protein kinase [Nitrospirota bacterium]